jgi:hypothetical protein
MRSARRGGGQVRGGADAAHARVMTSPSSAARPASRFSKPRTWCWRRRPREPRRLRSPPQLEVALDAVERVFTTTREDMQAQDGRTSVRAGRAGPPPRAERRGGAAGRGGGSDHGLALLERSGAAAAAMPCSQVVRAVHAVRQLDGDLRERPVVRTGGAAGRWARCSPRRARRRASLELRWFQSTLLQGP